MHIHLDPLGGIAGDMFIACMSDAFPELKQHIEDVIAAADFPEVKISFFSKHDKFLTGSGFKVLGAGCLGSDPLHDFHDHEHSHDHDRETRRQKPALPVDHPHRSYKEIKECLQSAKLSDAIKQHALAIFRLIGEAEAQVHAKELDSVQFHEVGGWDSVIDVVGAAVIIDWLGENTTWSYSALPVGGGYMECSHGLMPVPMPAVVLLLRGFQFRDDGASGERVTPTGAAVLKYLKPSTRLPVPPLVLKTVGYGFGTKEFSQLSNVLRACAYETSLIANDSEPISVLNFEVDDMTAEEIAVAAEGLRQTPGVVDVMQTSALGKKGRIATSLQILAHPHDLEKIVALILNETTTLGVRYQTIARIVVPRAVQQMKVDSNEVRVKVAHRPNGKRTAKVDIDDIKNSSSSCFDMRSKAITAENMILKEAHDPSSDS